MNNDGKVCNLLSVIKAKSKLHLHFTLMHQFFLSEKTDVFSDYVLKKVHKGDIKHVNAAFFFFFFGQAYVFFYF